MSLNNIHPTAIVDPNAKIGENVKIGPYSVVGPEVSIGNGTVIESHVVIEGETIIGENNYIFSFVSIGKVPQDLKFNGEKTRVIIGNNNKIREFVTIHRGTIDKYETRIGNDTLVMAYVHIAHDCIIGDHCVLANAATFAGHVEVEDWAVVGGLTAIHQFTRVGRHAMIGGCSAVNQDVVPYMLSEGNKARAVYINIVGLKRRGFSEEQIKTLREVYKIIFKKKLKLEKALQILEKDYKDNEDVVKLVEFIRKSKRGITR
ncbi:acyl-ACP--UDP-N-acetylglucosamine O-acyltransferase [Leptotrichia sp. HSP-334]|uniref:Acyl-[acyl-carrier-protein]--UDP-N-acetylglucosamine O-acyltransferase n=1 Tax=Leptotrichia rugosa TaxID=3239302 RepID=A0AB39VEW0_9FUSO